IIPATMIVNRYVRKKWACSEGHEIFAAPAPEGLIARARFEPSVYAHVAVAKYHDHVPLHRLSGILGRYGIPVAKQTMWDMLVTVDELVAQPILRQMQRELLECTALHADETEVTLRLEGGKGSKKAYLWCWRSLEGEMPSRALMDFRMTRNRHGPIDFLGDWTGTLIIDGYSGYNEVARINKIVRAGCWAHARRKWKDALDAGSKAVASVLVWIQRLFRLERAMNERIRRLELDPLGALALRHLHRGRYGRRIIEKAYEAADEFDGKRSTLPKSKLGKAVKYQFRQRETLEVFLSDPRIPIHNNAAERDIRHVAIGRKNWWVVASQRGGEVAARMYSLMLSCKQAGVNPETYLASVLQLISTTKDRDIAQLTPWGWGAMQAERAVDVLETRPS
ncbi:MAG: IS66 family transposase, partial [bacterium]|nr:IS66 family transposase [bacterium]